MTESNRKSFSILDVLIVFGVTLVILGMIGQNAAVRVVERWQKSELFEVSFVVRSYSVEDAKELIAAQQKGGLACTYEDKQIGTVLTLSRVDLPDGSKENAGVHQTLCELTGVLSVYGRDRGGIPVLYGCGEVKAGNVVPVSVEKRMLSLEITAVNVKKNEKPT